MFMKDLNGMELSKEIRKYNSQVKILMVTGYCKGDLLDSIEFKDAKISDVILKPVNFEELGPRILQICSTNKVVGSSKIR